MAQQSEFFQAPWRVGEPSPDLKSHNPTTIRSEGGKGWDVCHVFGKGPHADALVAKIEALPELFAALVDLVAMLEAGEAEKLGVNVLRFNGGPVTEGQYRAALTEARRAIRHARGGQ